MRAIKKFIPVMLIALLLSACSGQSTETKSVVMLPEDNGEIILTVEGYAEGDVTTFTLTELADLGTDTYTYSGRNKENNNERQIREYTGVELKDVLEAAGYGKPGEIIMVKCTDGYTREYEVDPLYGLFAFKDEIDETGKEVPPILAIFKEGEYFGHDKEYKPEDGSPLRLIYGQEDYDSEYTKDFNMQGWAMYVEKIEVREPNE